MNSNDSKSRVVVAAVADEIFVPDLRDARIINAVLIPPGRRARPVHRLRIEPETVSVPAPRNPEDDAALDMKDIDEQQIFAVEFHRTGIQDEIAGVRRQVGGGQNRVSLETLHDQIRTLFFR